MTDAMVAPARAGEHLDEPCWKDVLAPYTQASTRRATGQVLTSLLPYLALSVATYLTLGVSIALTVPLEILAAGFLVRTFVVFHDCTHGSLFPSRPANARVGALLGLFVLTPFVAWRHEHAVHHATSGDLDRRGMGDVDMLTVSEYRAKPRGGRLVYRLVRNPVVMLGLGPIVAMIIVPRFVPGWARPHVRRSVLLTDAVLIGTIALICWLIGPLTFVEVWLPVAVMAGAGGIWLFYVQHQFEDAYWERREDWNYTDAALRGSTYLKLPRVLEFFSASIGLHHVHHLSARVPNYNLHRAHAAHPAFAQVPTIGIAEGMRALRLKLWDEQSGKLVTFAQARRNAALAAARPAAAGAEA